MKKVVFFFTRGNFVAQKFFILQNPHMSESTSVASRTPTEEKKIRQIVQSYVESLTTTYEVSNVDLVKLNGAAKKLGGIVAWLM